MPSYPGSPPPEANSLLLPRKERENSWGKKTCEEKHIEESCFQPADYQARAGRPFRTSKRKDDQMPIPHQY